MVVQSCGLFKHQAPAEEVSVTYLLKSIYVYAITCVSRSGKVGLMVNKTKPILDMFIIFINKS